MTTNIKNKVINYYNSILLSIYKKIYIGTAYVPPNTYNTHIYDELVLTFLKKPYRVGDDITEVAFNAGQQDIINHIYIKYLQQNKDKSLESYIYDLSKTGR